MALITEASFIAAAHLAAAEVGKPVEPNFEAFLRFAFKYPKSMNKVGRFTLSPAEDPESTLEWVKTYVAKNLSERTRRISLAEMRTTPDPAVDSVLRSFAGYSSKKTELARTLHRVSMQAENVIGSLLEAYIAQKLEPLGWFWCSCRIIKGVDFFKSGSPVTLLQVKNRSNSENSSSNKIRESLRAQGCPVKIDKWHRIDAASGATNWRELPENDKGKPLSEDGFHAFLRKYEDG